VRMFPFSVEVIIYQVERDKKCDEVYGCHYILEYVLANGDGSV
jgi:hypothetical protein